MPTPPFASKLPAMLRRPTALVLVLGLVCSSSPAWAVQPTVPPSPPASSQPPVQQPTVQQPTTQQPTLPPPSQPAQPPPQPSPPSTQPQPPTQPQPAQPQPSWQQPPPAPAQPPPQQYYPPQGYYQAPAASPPVYYNASEDERLRKLSLSRRLMSSGFTMFGIGWIMALISGAGLIDASDGEGKRYKAGIALMIPVVGPFVAVGLDNDSAVGNVYQSLMGILQVAGLSMGIAGAVIFSKNNRRRMNVSALPSAGGLTLVGRF